MIREYIGFDQNDNLQEIGFSEDCYILKSVWGGKPLYQQTFRWFRNYHNLYHEIGVDQTTEPKFCYKIVEYKDNEWITCVFCSDLFYTYEETEKECINNLIKIVKNKQIGLNII